MFSTYDPDYIFAQLISRLQDDNINLEIDNKKWKITYDVVQEQEDGLQTEGCKVQVKLLKIDEKTLCVDFTRRGGSSWHFFEHFKMVKDHLNMLDDAQTV